MNRSTSKLKRGQLGFRAACTGKALCCLYWYSNLPCLDQQGYVQIRNRLSGLQWTCFVQIYAIRLVIARLTYEAAGPGKMGKTWQPAMAGSLWWSGSKPLTNNSSGEIPNALWYSNSLIQACFIYWGLRTAFFTIFETLSSIHRPK